ncbi:MAG: hypothetical protein ACLFQ1_07805, partial [Halochromatium sp.]
HPQAHSQQPEVVMSSDSSPNDAASASTKPKNKEPYQQAYYPPVPTGFTCYLRTSLLWQFWRFIAINLKMFKLMLSSHH